MSSRNLTLTARDLLGLNIGIQSQMDVTSFVQVQVERIFREGMQIFVDQISGSEWKNHIETGMMVASLAPLAKESLKTGRQTLDSQRIEKFLRGPVLTAMTRNKTKTSWTDISGRQQHTTKDSYLGYEIGTDMYDFSIRKGSFQFKFKIKIKQWQLAEQSQFMGGPWNTLRIARKAMITYIYNKINIEFPGWIKTTLGGKVRERQHG